MKRALQIIGGVVVLCICMMMIVVIGGGGGDEPTEATNEIEVVEETEEQEAAPTEEVEEAEPTEEAEPEPTGTPGQLSMTDFVQSAEEKGWTDAQFSTYLDGLKGQEISGWSGTVVEIDTYVGEPYFSLEVKEGKPDIDVYLYVTEEDMQRVLLGQDVTFDGTVREKWHESDGFYALQVENPTLVELGEAPPTAVPTEVVEEEAAPAAEKYQLGDVISIEDTILVVLGWDISAGDDFMKPDEGNQFIAVELLLVNQADDTAAISSLLQMSLKDDTGQEYNTDFMASGAAGSSAPDGELSAGERVRGKVDFQVPEGTSGLEFVFDASMFTSGKIFVELGPEPMTLEPPAELAGEQEQDAYAVGDVIEIGDLRMVVNEVLYPAGDDFIKPEAGNYFVAVDVTFENLSEETKNISSLLQMELKDETGQGYNVDMMGSSATGGSTPDGELAPGEKLRGQVGYQVPERATGLVFVFDADIFGSGKVRVAIESSPTSETQVVESSNQALFTEAPEVIGNSREAWESRFGQGTKGSFGYSYEGPYSVTVSYWGDYLNYVDIQWSEVVSWDEANAVINGYIPSDVTWLEYYRSDSGRYVDLYSSNRLADRLGGEYEEQGVRPGLLIVSYLEESDGVIDAIIATPAEVDLIGSQALANGSWEPAPPTQAPQTEQEQPAGGTEEQVVPTEAPLPTEPPPPTLAPEPTNPPFTCIGGCATPPDPSCSIKGNVNPSNKTWIYHVPGGAFYNRTDIKSEEGDRWFCTWQEAEAAGFRASER